MPSPPQPHRVAVDPSGGFSLIEMLLTPGVMALLLMAMFLIYPRIRDASAAREAAATIETAKARIRAAAGVRANYARLTQTSANTFLPEGCLYANGGGNPRGGCFPNPNNVLFYLAGVAPPGQASLRSAPMRQETSWRSVQSWKCEAHGPNFPMKSGAWFTTGRFLPVRPIETFMRWRLARGRCSITQQRPT